MSVDRADLPIGTRCRERRLVAEQKALLPGAGVSEATAQRLDTLRHEANHGPTGNIEPG
jgi:hypothetical protein